MCKINNNINNTIEYYSQLCGQELNVKPTDREIKRLLPIIITGAYNCYSSEIIGIPVLLLEVKNPEAVTPMQLQKHQDIVTAKTGMHTIFILKEVASYNLTRMAAARVNFIIPGKQILIPSLMMNMKAVKVSRVLEEEIIPGASQCLLLYQLEKSYINGKTASELSEMFHVSYPNMSRALRWLEMKGLCKLEGQKTKKLVFEYNKNALWDKALPLLASPVDRIVYTDSEIQNSKIAGESAMERLTMMATPQRPCIAINKQTAKEQKNLLDKNYGNTIVEIWRYDPKLLTDGDTVDPLSLYLSLRNNEDERIQIEIDKLINFE